MYKLQQSGVKRLSDEASIPNADSNKDWQEYQLWLSEGNTPEPEFTEEDLAQNIQNEINAESERFLIDADWKTTRHRDQRDSEKETSLTEAEYQLLLTEKQTKRDSIIK